MRGGAIEMKQFKGRPAVITGAASGFGLEASRIAAREGMYVVMAHVQADALQAATAEIEALGAPVLAQRMDVSSAEQVASLADATQQCFGVPQLVFNNAGVGGGLIWENTLADWQWVLGVNLMGVVHGIRSFVPMMLEAARRDASCEGHGVNTASMAGLVNPLNMGVYNASKHAVVSISETLHQDLRLVTGQVSASVLCPFFVGTGITRSERNRPAGLPAAPPTKSQLIGQAMTDKAVGSGKVSAAMMARYVFDALREQRFHIYSHPQAQGSGQQRLEDVVQARNPSDPFAQRPEVGAQLRAALRDAD